MNSCATVLVKNHTSKSILLVGKNSPCISSVTKIVLSRTRLSMGRILETNAFRIRWGFQHLVRAWYCCGCETKCLKMFGPKTTRKFLFLISQRRRLQSKVSFPSLWKHICMNIESDVICGFKWNYSFEFFQAQHKPETKPYIVNNPVNCRRGYHLLVKHKNLF